MMHGVLLLSPFCLADSQRPNVANLSLRRMAQSILCTSRLEKYEKCIFLDTRSHKYIHSCIDFWVSTCMLPIFEKG